MSAASTGLPRHAPCWGTKFRRVCEKVAKKKQGVALLSWLRGHLSANRLYNEFTVGGVVCAMLLPDFRQARVYSGEDPKAELVLTF